MGILNLMIATAAEASIKWSSESDVTTPQLNGHVTSWIDFAITVVICVTVCISLCILAKSINKFASGKRTDVKEKQQIESNKKSEQNNDSISTKDRYDAAWRFFNMCWKVEHPDLMKDDNVKLGANGNTQKLSSHDITRYEEAWSVIREYMGVKAKQQDKGNK